MTIVLGVATAVLVAITLLPMWRHPHWTVRGLEFPRLQFAVCGALVLVGLIVLPDRWAPLHAAMLAAVCFCLAWQIWWILPYTSVWPREVRPAAGGGTEHRIRLLTSNVLMSNRNADSLIALVKRHRPDLLLTLESDHWWQSRLDALETDMPHTIKCPLDNLYGMHVYSRLPVSDPEIAYLVENDKPSMHALFTLRSGERIRMHFLHPAPPSPTENPESAERDAELIVVARSVADSRYPIIVAGDLNDVAWSTTTRLFRKISGLLDPRVGRGLFNTFHAAYPFMRWPLDHVFHSRHFTLVSMRRLPAIGSDHFPLLAELSYAPARDSGPDGIDASREDHSRARETAERKKARPEDVPRPG